MARRTYSRNWSEVQASSHRAHSAEGDPDQRPEPPGHRLTRTGHAMNRTRKAIFGAAAVGASIMGGALGASLVNGTASAQTDSSSTSSSAPADAPTTPPADGRGGPGGGGPHNANGITEQVLTGDDAAKATAAAQTAVPDGTIDRVETDAEGAAFEAHMTKSDGSHVTVKLNSDFTFASIEDGMK